MEIFPWHVLFDWDYLQGKIAVRRSWLWDCLSTLSCVQKQPYMPKFWTRDYTQSTYIFIWTTKIIDNACLLQIIADDLIPNISNLWTCLPRTFFNSSSGLVIALLPNFFPSATGARSPCAGCVWRSHWNSVDHFMHSSLHRHFDWGTGGLGCVGVVEGLNFRASNLASNKQKTWLKTNTHLPFEASLVKHLSSSKPKAWQNHIQYYI